MTRTLLLIACVGFVMAVACLGGAAALGGRELAVHGWTLNNAHFRIDGDNADHRVGFGWEHPADVDGGGPTVTREIAWDGGDSLEVDAPVDLRFTQATGAAKLVITGPKGTVDQLRLSGSQLDFDREPANAQRVTIVMTAPDVRHFTLDGEGVMSIAGYDHDQLELELNGEDQVTAQGRAQALRLQISGDGNADLSRLATERAQVEIDGSGRTTIAPTRQADLEISGDGEIDLTTHPADVHSEVSGSGRIVQGSAATSRPR